MSYNIRQKIAAQNCKHSWAQKILSADYDLWAEAEDRMSKWFKKEAEKIYPGEGEFVGKMAWWNYEEVLEAEAIWLYQQQEPWNFGAVEPLDCLSAVTLASMDIFNSQENPFIDKAINLLDLVESGKLKPDLDKILAPLDR